MLGILTALVDRELTTVSWMIHCTVTVHLYGVARRVGYSAVSRAIFCVHSISNDWEKAKLKMGISGRFNRTRYKSAFFVLKMTSLHKRPEIVSKPTLYRPRNLPQNKHFAATRG